MSLEIAESDMQSEPDVVRESQPDVVRRERGTSMHESQPDVVRERATSMQFEPHNLTLCGASCEAGVSELQAKQEHVSFMRIEADEPDELFPEEISSA